jgi:hypothetical protein
MKIDRPGAAIIGGVLMLAFRTVGKEQALQSIDFTTIVLLHWGTGRCARRPRPRRVASPSA